MPKLPLQDEPESTVGRKPGRGFEHHGPEGGTPVRSGATLRREEGDETEAGSEIREREGGEEGAEDEAPIVLGLDE